MVFNLGRRYFFVFNFLLSKGHSYWYTFNFFVNLIMNIYPWLSQWSSEHGFLLSASDISWCRLKRLSFENLFNWHKPRKNLSERGWKSRGKNPPEKKILGIWSFGLRPEKVDKIKRFWFYSNWCFLVFWMTYSDLLRR